MNLNVDLLKRGLLLFWALWLTIVTATNLSDLLKSFGVLPDSWSFASGNLQFMREVTAVHGTPGWLIPALFVGVICWEALAALLHWHAWYDSRSVPVTLSRPVRNAFAVSAALWAAFILSDEIFIAYQVEATHFRVFIAALASILVLALVPTTEHS